MPADLILDGSQSREDLVAAGGEAVRKYTATHAGAGLPPVFAALAERMGREILGNRLDRQSTHWAGLTHQGDGLLAVERIIPLDKLVSFFLRWTGLEKWGRQGAQDLRLQKNVIRSVAVPPNLSGLRILQLSDLHADLETGIQPRLVAMVKDLEYDLVVITGDFRDSTQGDFACAMAATRELIPELHQPIFGILGNHDFVEMVPLLEEAGVRMLMNESVCLPYGGSSLWLAGIDDPHFYQTHQWDRVRHASNSNIFRILLSHSPETYLEAAPWFDLMLSGHTHGGQICLPGGIALIRNGNCPADLIDGAWRRDTMHGYTSRGTGCCGVAARFFCPPEITLHTLERVEN